MEKNKAIKILSKIVDIKYSRVNMPPGQYLEKHTHDWDVDIIILEGNFIN